MSDADAAQQLARACADHMWARDLASRKLGMTVEVIAPGAAAVSMVVTAVMLGPDRQCKKGLLSTLADSAMAYASNSHGKLAVAQTCDITYDADVGLGTRLVASATERRRAGRKGMYDVRVETADGTIVAEFRGQTIALGDLLGKAEA